MSIKSLDKIEIVRNATSLSPTDLISNIQVPSVGVSLVRLPTTNNDTLVATNTVQTLTNKTITIGSASRALVTDASGNISVSATLSSEIAHLSGATSNIQTQLNTALAKIGLKKFASNTTLSTDDTSPTVTNSLIIGINSVAVSNNAVALGTDATVGAGSGNSIAVGYSAEAHGQDAIAIGSNAYAVGAGDTAINGVTDSISAFSSNNVAIAGSVRKDYAFGMSDITGSLTIHGLTYGKDGISIGSSSRAGENSLAVGINSEAGAENSNIGATAIGQNSTATGEGLAVGKSTTATNYGITVGNSSGASDYGIAIGVSSSATEGVAIGRSSQAGSNGIALGRGAIAGANKLAIGSASYPISIGAPMGGAPVAALEIIINGTTYYIELRN